MKKIMMVMCSVLIFLCSVNAFAETSATMQPKHLDKANCTDRFEISSFEELCESVFQKENIVFDDTSSRYLEKELNNISKAEVVVYDNQTIAITTYHTEKEYSDQKYNYKDISSNMSILGYNYSTEERNTAVTAYGIMGTSTLNYTVRVDPSPTSTDMSIRFNTLSLRYVDLPTASTYVSSIGGSVNMYHLFIQDYYNDYYVNNPSAGVTYTKNLYSGFVTWYSSTVELSVMLTFTNGQSASYTRQLYFS